MKSEDTTARLIGEYENAAAQTEPNNLKLVRSLAELYTQKKEFETSLELYDRIKNSDMGNDPSLDTRDCEHDCAPVRPPDRGVEPL